MNDGSKYEGEWLLNSIHGKVSKAFYHNKHLI